MDDDSPWMEVLDESTGQIYYANIKTGVTTWEKPDQLEVKSSVEDDPPKDDNADDKPVVYTTSSGRFAAISRKTDYKSRVATALLDEVQHELNEALEEPVLATDQNDAVAIADLDLNEADQFDFSDEEDNKPCLSMKDRKLMRGDSSASLGGRHSRYLSRQSSISKNILTEPPRPKHKRQASEHAGTNETSPFQDYGSRLKVLDGNSWDGLQISTIPLPSWPKPSASDCQTEAALYPFSGYVAAHFIVPKSWFGSSSATPDMNTIVRHSNGKLKAPLSKETCSSADGQTTSAQMYKNIQSFMQDRKSSKDWFGHASRIVKVALSGNEDIRNEIYLLIVKQISKNPSMTSLDLGWRLMLICCCIFGPSEELACYLRSFFFQQLLENIQEPQNTIVVACIHSLELTMARGNRLEQPLEEELTAIKNLQPNIARVHLLHGESVQVAVHSQSTVHDVLALCCEFFDTDQDEGLTLCETVLDGKGGRLFLPLEYGDRIMDLVTSRPSRSRELLENAGCNIVDNARLLEFVFRVRMFRADSLNESKMRGNIGRCFHLKKQARLLVRRLFFVLGGTRSMIFVEVVDSVLHGYHKLTNNDYISLGGLIIQSCFDCRHVEIVDMIRNKLDKIIPSKIRLEYTESELVSKIEAHVYRLGDVMTTSKARRLFLDEAQHMPTFGSNFFHIEKLTTTKKGHIESEPMIMAVSWRGLLLLQIGTHEIVQGIVLNEFLTYGMKDGKILMVVGSLIRHEKLMFSSWQSGHIDRAIRLCCRQSPAVMALGANATTII